MTHFIIVVYIYLDSDYLRFGCVNYFIVLGWLRLFRKKIKDKQIPAELSRFSRGYATYTLSFAVYI